MTMKGLCFIDILVFHKNGLLSVVCIYGKPHFFGNNNMSDCDVTYGALVGNMNVLNQWFSNFSYQVPSQVFDLQSSARL